MPKPVGTLNHTANHTAKIMLRVPPSMHAWIKAKADRDLRSMNSQIVACIRAAMDQAAEA
jgi:predicted HicB family RNase H-like nuclease